MQKNDVVTVKIIDMGTSGEGIGKVDGMTLFIKDAIIGDVVQAKIMKLKKNYGYARMMEIVESSSYRVEPVCPVSRQCGGCQIQAMSYEQQLKFKEEKVKNNLIRIGGIAQPPMEPIIGMDEPYHFRNKEQFPIRRLKDGTIGAGFFASRTHSIIPIKKCEIGAAVNEQVMDAILELLNKYQIEPYDEETHTGLVRHVLIRYGFTSKEVMVCIVVNGKKLPHAEEIVEALKKIDGMTSITLNSNTKKTNVILGDEITTLWGQSYITDELDGIKFQISPLSFYQVNPVQTEKLYSKAMEYAQLSGTETVWDLYCGIGTISLFLSQKAGKVYGVEIVPQAIEDAKRNATLNGIENVEFYVGKAEEVVPAFYETEMKKQSGNEHTTDEEKATRNDCVETSGEDTGMKLHPEVIVVDPPRKGCEEKLLETMIQMQPDRIVYVSCDSATLARDLKYLCANGYELKAVTPVDQFGHSVHIESCCLLTKL